jgi:hypothetical protein
VDDAKKMKHELEQELAAVSALQDAMDRMDLKALETAIAAAESMGLKRDRNPELGDALSTLEAIKRKMETDAAKLATELKVCAVTQSLCVYGYNVCSMLLP